MVVSSVAVVAVGAVVRDKGRARVALSSRVVRTVARRRANRVAQKANRRVKSHVHRVARAELHPYSKGVRKA